MNKRMIRNFCVATAVSGAFIGASAYAADDYYNKPRSSTPPSSTERAQQGEPAGDSGAYGRARSDTPAATPATPAIPATPPSSSERAQQGEPAGDSGMYGRGSVGATTKVDKESKTLEQDSATRQQFGAPAGDSGPMGKSSAIGEQQPGRQNTKPSGSSSGAPQ